jgi:DNA-binding MarR family transcriptional regulator
VTLPADEPELFEGSSVTGTAGSTRDEPAAAGGLDQSSMAHLLGYHITQASVPSRKAFMRHIGTPYRLSPVEFTILMLVANNRDATHKQLSQALMVSAPAVTTLLDRLSERGLIARVRNESDRRSQNVRLTRRGAALQREVREISLGMERDLVRHLSGSEQAILIELLQKVARGGR